MPQEGDRVGGSCLCGAVRFEVTLPSKFCAHCHCGNCRKAHGAAARRRVERMFSLSGMMARYTELYDSVLRQKLPDHWAAATQR